MISMTWAATASSRNRGSGLTSGRLAGLPSVKGSLDSLTVMCADPFGRINDMTSQSCKDPVICCGEWKPKEPASAGPEPGRTGVHPVSTGGREHAPDRRQWQVIARAAPSGETAVRTHRTSQLHSYLGVTF